MSTFFFFASVSAPVSITLTPAPLVIEFTIPSPTVLQPTLQTPAPLVVEFTIPPPSMPIILTPAPIVLEFTIPAATLTAPLAPAPLVIEFTIPEPTLRRARNTPIAILPRTGPPLATVYVHSPWYPRQRLALLTTASGTDRSYTAVSRLGSKDTGQAGFSVSAKDPAVLRDPGVLQHGNIIAITSPKAPPWVGVLLTTNEDDTSRQIELSAISYEALLDGRVTPQGQKYTKSVGANAVFQSLAEEANARNHTGMTLPQISEITAPIEDLEVGGQSVLEALNELCGRTNSEWWLEYEVTAQFIKATLRFGFLQGYDLSQTKHYYQGTHFTAQYKQDMSQVKAAVTAIGDFGADLPDRNSVARVASLGPAQLGLQAAAVHEADVVAARKMATQWAGPPREKVTFEIMTGTTSELSRRGGLVQERPLQAERMFNVNFFDNVDWNDTRVGNFVTLWGEWRGRPEAHVVRVMAAQPSEEAGVCSVVAWEP